MWAGPTSILLLAALFLLTPCGVRSQENCRVRSIEFSGNATLSKDDLLKQVEMYETGWFSENILQKDPFLFSGKVLEADLHKIREYYQKEGFLRVVVGPAVLTADQGSETLEIVIPVEEGKAVTVDSVAWELLVSDSRQDSSVRALIRETGTRLRLVPPARFRDEFVNLDQVAINRGFLESGYPHVTVRYGLTVDTLKNTVRVSWVVDPGPRSMFGEVRFTGDTGIRRSLLDNRIEFAAGETFDQKKLEMTQEEIYGLSRFRVVNVKALLEEREDDRIPVQITLQDAAPFRARIGAGYGKEEKFRVLAQLTWLGVLGGPGKLDLEAKHSALEAYSVSGKYTHPDFLFPKLTLSLYPYMRRELEPAYTNRRLGLRASIEKKAWRAVLLSLSQTLERVELDTSSVSPVTLQGGLLDTYPKSSVSLGMIRSTGSPLLNPADGSYESLLIMYSGLGAGTPYHFLKVTVDLRRYDPLWGHLILATRLEMGGIRSYDSDGFVPVEERFYSGGSTSVRGWDRYLLGPLDAAGQPLGGKSLVEGSVEVRFPLSASFGATVFMDLGNVWQESFDFRFDGLRYCAGAGVRLETPIGPIRFDCAVPLFEGEQSPNFFFSIGQAF